jgi:transcriptional regulator with XRE-family HTH domain
MTLKEWLNKNKVSQKTIAAQLNMDTARLSRIVNGRENPTLFQADEIYRLTNKKVTLQDWLKVGKK